MIQEIKNKKRTKQRLQLKFPCFFAENDCHTRRSCGDSRRAFIFEIHHLHIIETMAWICSIIPSETKITGSMKHNNVWKGCRLSSMSSSASFISCLLWCKITCHSVSILESSVHAWHRLHSLPLNHRFWLPYASHFLLKAFRAQFKERQQSVQIKARVTSCSSSVNESAKRITKSLRSSCKHHRLHNRQVSVRSTEHVYGASLFSWCFSDAPVKMVTKDPSIPLFLSWKKWRHRLDCRDGISFTDPSWISWDDDEMREWILTWMYQGL